MVEVKLTLGRNFILKIDTKNLVGKKAKSESDCSAPTSNEIFGGKNL